MLCAPMPDNRYQQAELVHCRFAMLGVAGVLFPEVLKGAGLGGPAAQVPWFDAGKFEYFASADALFGVQMLLFAWVELRRLQVGELGSMSGAVASSSRVSCAPHGSATSLTC